MALSGHKELVLSIGYRHAGNSISWQIKRVNRSFVIVSLITTHRELPGRDRHPFRLAIGHGPIAGPGPHQGFGNLQRLFTGGGLGQVEIGQVDPATSGVAQIEGVFHINKSAYPILILAFGDDIQAEGGLAAAFRDIDVGDSASRQATDPQSGIEGGVAGGDGFYPDVGGIAQLPDDPVDWN